MSGLAVTGLLAALLVVTPDSSWLRRLETLRLGAPVPKAALRGTVKISVEEPGGPSRALLRTGFLADLNRHDAAPRGPAGLDLERLARVHVGEGGGVRWLLATDRAGRLTGARIEVPVPVLSEYDGSLPGSSPRRLGRLRDALRGLAPRALSVTERDHRGNPFAWRGRAVGGALWVRHRPEQDLLTVLLAGR